MPTLSRWVLCRRVSAYAHSSFFAKPFYAEIDTALDQIPLDHRSFQFRHLHLINFQFRKKITTSA
jgi:hypothetical protein